VGSILLEIVIDDAERAGQAAEIKHAVAVMQQYASSCPDRVPRLLRILRADPVAETLP
jgi:hypothetical protein